MEILYQEKENECGICVIGMLANEINELNLDRSDILKHAKLSTEGITLLDLEELGIKFGLQIESYECEFSELKELNNNEWYIALIKKYNGFHYVVFQPNKKGFHIFDSDKGKYFLEPKEFQAQFANLICTVQSSKFNFNKLLKNKNINWTYFLSLKAIGICLVLELILISIGILLTQFLKILIENTIGFGTTYNLLIIIVPFVIIKVIEQITEYLVNLIKSNNEKEGYKSLWNHLLTFLNKHPFKFYEQNFFGTIFEIDIHIKNIINFFTIKIPSYINSIILGIITFSILASTNIFFILISFIQIIVGSIIITIKYFLHKHQYRKSIMFLQNQNNYLSKLNNLLINENIYFDYEHIAKLLKNNLSINAKHNQNIFLDVTTIDNILEFTKFIFWILILAIGINLIVENNSINISELMYILSIQALLVNNIDNLISFSFTFSLFKSSSKKINGYFDIDNENFVTKEINEILNISFKNIKIEDGSKLILENWNAYLKNFSVLVGKNGSGKSSLLKALTSKLKLSDGEIKINNIQIDKIDKNWLIKNVIYIDGNKCSNNLFSIEYLINFINLNELNIETKKIINEINLFETNPIYYSNGQIQVIKLLFLQNIKNKIILLDEPLSAVNNSIKLKVFNNLIKSLIKNNFVVLVEHDLNLINEANEIIEVKNNEI
ncbi:cysteine peptidase family C39 domain-containing protein [Mycoplasmoides pirum]|uniref:cysteine peptidase family C39 domain-containing protein n=1 Tax=Mycoplasmoides pirum TaxID=2122 RepID=UPI000486F05A|nr:cysteine peptidase family C39 domain-containing protein [Mycoplasmoides pirum]